MENKPEPLKIEVREAKPEDALGITKVLYQAWLATYPNAELGITVDDIEESYREAFTDERIRSQQEKISNLPANQKRLVAKVGDLIVGMTGIIKERDHGHLRSIYILPEFQGRGVGTYLWEETRKFCDPAKDIIVHVATYNRQAINFYEKLGFVDTGKRFSEERFRMKSGALIPEMEMVIKAKKD